jgi:uncharacterized membrane protein HdeD (DUF308 family)
MNFMCVALGILVLSDGLFKIQIAIEAKSFGISKWWLILTFALAACALGFLLLVRPNESADAIIRLLGIALLAEGVLNLSTVVTSVKIINHQRPDTIEVNYIVEGEERR